MNSVPDIKAEYFDKMKYFCNARTADKNKENTNLSELLTLDMKTIINIYNKGIIPRIPAVDIYKYNVEHIPQILEFMSCVDILNIDYNLNINQNNEAIKFLEKMYKKVDTLYFIYEPYRIYILIDYKGEIIIFRDEFTIAKDIKSWITPKLDTFPNRIFVYKMSVNFNIINNILNELVIKQSIKSKFEIDYIFQSIYDNLIRCLDTDLKMTKEVLQEYKDFIILSILKRLPSAKMIYGYKLPLPKFHSLSEC